MPDRLVGRLRWLFGAAVVVAVGGGVLVAVGVLPAPGVAMTASAEGTMVAVAPGAVAAFAAVIVFVAALSAMLAWRPRRFAHLMPVLASAAAAAALAFLASGAWLGFAAALVCAALSASAWIALWLSPRPSIATRARDTALLDAMLDAIVPAGGPFALGATDAELRECVTRAFAARHRGKDTWLRLALRLLDARSILEHRRGFARLDTEARAAIVARLARSRVPALRAVGETLKSVVVGLVYEDARALEQIGYDASWVQSRIDAGPNCEAHRERREAEARAARLAEEARLAAARAAELDEEVAPVEEELAAPELEIAPSDEAQATSPEAPTPQTSAPEASAVDDKAPQLDDEPFDRPWTLGVPHEPVAPAAPALGVPLLRAIRALGPTRP